jgi:hypothetical protein
MVKRGRTRLPKDLAEAMRELRKLRAKVPEQKPRRANTGTGPAPEIESSSSYRDRDPDEDQIA